MGESRETPLVVEDSCYPNALVEVFEAAAGAREPVQAWLEAFITMSEPDPKAAHAALWRLQTDWETLKCLETELGGDPTEAALRIGAAIHLARAELASPAPQLRRRLPEMMEWLGRRRELSLADD